MAAYRHLLPPMPITNRVYGNSDPGDHGHSAGTVVGGGHSYDSHATTNGQASNSPVVMMSNHQSSHIHQQQQQQQQQFHHPPGMHLLQQQQQHQLHHHNHHSSGAANQHHHHLSYQQFNVGGQHVNLARHLLATGQAHQQQQVMHNNNPMKGMIYHAGLRTGVVPLNASKCEEFIIWVALINYTHANGGVP